METIALLFLFGIFIILSYTLGLKNGQELRNIEDIKMPEINPVHIVRNFWTKEETRCLWYYDG